MKTFRTRLILWNVVLLTVGLVGFGALLLSSSEQLVMAGIDRDLTHRASQAAPPRGQGGPPGFNGPRGTAQNMGQGFGADNPPPSPSPHDVRLPRWQNRGGQIGSPAGPVELFSTLGVDRAWRGEVDVRTVSWNGRTIRVATVPVGRERPIQRIGQAAVELEGIQGVFQRQRGTLLFLIPVAMIASALAGLFLANRALRPVEAMAGAAERIGAEDLSQRLPAIGDDEMAQLARTLNGLIARLQESFARQRQAYEKLESAYESQRQFTADASHELRTPLSRMKLVSSAALVQSASLEEREEALQIVDRTADEMSRLVQDLLDLARADAAALTLKLEPVNLAAAAESAADEFRLIGAPKLLVEGKGTAAADPRALHRILRNLLANAVRHTPEEGLIVIRIAEGRIEVEDTGEGIAPEHLPRVAERFYRGDMDRSRSTGGTGLGLAITKTLVEAQGGTMTIRSEPQRGTSVCLSLASPESL